MRLQKLHQFHTIKRNICRVDITQAGFSTGLGFGNTGTQWHADSTRYRAEKIMATHGAMGGAPLQASKQFDEPRYWAAVAEAEVMAMFSIEAKAKDYLAQAGETGELKLDLLPMCTPWDQTAPTRHRPL